MLCLFRGIWAPPGVDRFPGRGPLERHDAVRLRRNIGAIPPALQLVERVAVERPIFVAGGGSRATQAGDNTGFIEQILERRATGGR